MVVSAEENTVADLDHLLMPSFANSGRPAPVTNPDPIPKSREAI